MKMRFNKYTLKIDNGNKTILYNVITKILIEVDYNINCIDDEFFSNLSKEDEEEYREKLLISDDENDDILEMEKIKYDYNHQKEIGHFMIHMGYACNLKCTYCYQSVIDSVDKNMKINPKNVIDFIIKAARQNCFDVLDICFIGGEPLLYRMEMIQIAECLNRELEDMQILYSVVTNGTLMDNMDDLVNCGIIDYQITLDGPQKIHDIFRRNGKVGSYAQIVRNIQNVMKNYPEIFISLNCNLTEKNYNYIEEFFYELGRENIEVPIMFSMVFDNGVNIALECHSHNNIWKNAHKVAINHGQQFDPFYRDLYLGCALTQENYFVIGADEGLYKCINAVNDKNYYVSQIKDYGSPKYKEYLNKFLNYEINNRECKLCELYPVCFGGCKYRNEINGFQCNKEEIYKNEIEIIRMMINA